MVIRIPTNSRMGQAIIDARHESQAGHEQRRVEDDLLERYIEGVLYARGFDVFRRIGKPPAGMPGGWDAKEVQHVYKVDDTEVTIGVKVAEKGKVVLLHMEYRSTGGYQIGGSFNDYDDLIRRIQSNVVLEGDHG